MLKHYPQTQKSEHTHTHTHTHTQTRTLPIIIYSTISQPCIIYRQK